MIDRRNYKEKLQAAKDRIEVLEAREKEWRWLVQQARGATRHEGTDWGKRSKHALEATSGQ